MPISDIAPPARSPHARANVMTRARYDAIFRHGLKAPSRVTLPARRRHDSFSFCRISGARRLMSSTMRCHRGRPRAEHTAARRTARHAHRHEYRFSAHAIGTCRPLMARPPARRSSARVADGRDEAGATPRAPRCQQCISPQYGHGRPALISPLTSRRFIFPAAFCWPPPFLRLAREIADSRSHVL